MARVIETQFKCNFCSLVTLGDRVYGISCSKLKLLCLDPVTEEQTSISLGAAAQHEQPLQSLLVGCEGKIFVCLQFCDCCIIIKYDPAAKTLQKVNAPSGSQGGWMETAVELNGKVYLVCSGGVWELNPAMEATMFFKANLGDSLYACASDGKLCILSYQSGNLAWELDPVTCNLQFCCPGPSHGSWRGTANLQGRIYASSIDENGSRIFELRRAGITGVTSFKEVASVKGVWHDSMVAISQYLVMSSDNKLVVHNQITGVLESSPLQLSPDSANTRWLQLCAACGKLVGLSQDGFSLLVVDLQTAPLGLVAPTADDLARQAMKAAAMMEELLARLHRVMAKGEAATAHDSAVERLHRVKAKAEVATPVTEEVTEVIAVAANVVFMAESCASAALRQTKAAQAAQAVAAEAAAKSTERVMQAESSASAALLQAEAAEAAAAAAVESTKKVKEEKCEMQRVAAWQMMAHLPFAGEDSRGLLSVLPSSDPRNAMLCELLKQSCVPHRWGLRAQDFCPAPDLVPTEVSLVCNPGLADQYRLARKQRQERQPTDPCHPLLELEHLLLPRADGCGKNQLNEVLLFHGAPLDTVEKICQEGFDPRRGGEAVGAMFGIGTYFAENASKADIYTERYSTRLPRGAPRKQIVARVLLGEAYQATTDLRNAHRPPDSPSGRPYDSVWADTKANGGAVDHREFIIYDKVQAVPVLVITYHHQTTCQCAECGKRPAH